MIPSELLVAWGAIVLAAVWIIWQQRKLNEQDEALENAEAALEAADQAINIYQHVFRDVAIGHTTLEVTDEGHIIATHCAAGKVSLH